MSGPDEFAQARRSARPAKGPEPIALRGKIAPPGPYPIDALGEIAGRAARAIMYRVQVPDALAAHSVLAAISVAVQGFVVVRLPHGSVRPTSVFLTTIAESGERKTAADELALEALSEHELALHAEYEHEKLVHSVEFAAWKSAKDKLSKDGAGTAASRRQSVEELGAPPPEPMLPAMIIPPGSTQGVLSVLEKGRPSAALFHNDGGAFLGSWGMSDENLTATITAFSDLWDGKPIKTLTKGEGYKFLPGRAFSFHIMFQNFYLERMFGNEEMRQQGFLARMLSACPETLAGTRLRDPTEQEPSGIREDLAAYKERLSTIVKARLPIKTDAGNALDRRAIAFDDDAQRIFWEFYNHIERQQGNDGALASIRGFAGKAAENACRLAATLHVFQNGTRNLMIGAAAMAAGVELMNFYIGEALRLSDHDEGDELTRRGEELSEWLAKWALPEIGMSHIQQQGPRSIRKLAVGDVREICALLARNDHITRLESGATIEGKRCREAWKVNVGR